MSEVFPTEAVVPQPAPVAPQTPDQPQVPVTDQLLGMIVNDQGQPKYNSIEDALKGASAAQQHIAKLEAENAGLRSVADQAASAEDIIKAVQASQGEQEPALAPAQAPQVTEADLASLVERTIVNREVQTKENANINTVALRSREAYGEKAEEMFYSKAAEKGLSREMVNTLAAQSPQAVFDLLGIKSASAATPAPTTPSMKMNGYTPATDKPKSAMGHITDGELMESWNAHKVATLKKLGIEE
jgi:hypothetical protein